MKEGRNNMCLHVREDVGITYYVSMYVTYTYTYACTYIDIYDHT